jgi:hypothetical protein
VSSPASRGGNEAGRGSPAGCLVEDWQRSTRVGQDVPTPVGVCLAGPPVRAGWAALARPLPPLPLPPAGPPSSGPPWPVVETDCTPPGESTHRERLDTPAPFPPFAALEANLRGRAQAGFGSPNQSLRSAGRCRCGDRGGWTQELHQGPSKALGLVQTHHLECTPGWTSVRHPSCPPPLSGPAAALGEESGWVWCNAAGARGPALGATGPGLGEQSTCRGGNGGRARAAQPDTSARRAGRGPRV